MTSSAVEMNSPFNDSGHSRLTATIVTLVVLAFILAGVFIYLESGQRVQPLENVLTAQAKAQYINEMQAVVQSQPAIPADQKAALIQAMSEKLKANK